MAKKESGKFTDQHLAAAETCLHRAVAFVVPAPPRKPPASSAACGTDSTFAEAYRATLQRMYRDTLLPAAVVHWSRPSADLCKAARLAMWRDSIAGLKDEILYVYTMTGAGVVRYAILSYSALRKRGSEWPAGVCFFDEHWKPQGVCLAM